MVSRLSAVNYVLESSGDAPIDSAAEIDDAADAGSASRQIDEAVEFVCQFGWHALSDTEYELSPDVNGIVAIPQKALRIKPTTGKQSWPNEYVERSYTDETTGITQRRVYNRAERTFVITETPIYLDVNWTFTFEELPPAFQDYVQKRAARRYQEVSQGSLQQDSLTVRSEIEAHDKLLEVEMTDIPANMFDQTSAAWTAFAFRGPSSGGNAAIR